VATIDLYHYARSENLDSISDEGLKTGSRFFMMDVPSRNNAVYLWLAPDYDVMGYNENPQYVCLRVRVDTTRGQVAPMELISAAYVNHIGQRQPRNPELAARLVAAYEKALVPINEYQNGQFRAPEVLVQGEIDPDDIAVVKAPESNGRGEGNRRAYASRWAEQLIRILGIQRTQMTLNELTEAALNRGAAVRVAKHDDATAYLETYMLVESGDFFTIEKED
jgi:hypothetical protein